MSKKICNAKQKKYQLMLWYIQMDGIKYTYTCADRKQLFCVRDQNAQGHLIAA